MLPPALPPPMTTLEGSMPRVDALEMHCALLAGCGGWEG
jgi:hypothetical protein